jgi:hypothetical protein
MKHIRYLSLRHFLSILCLYILKSYPPQSPARRFPLFPLGMHLLSSPALRSAFEECRQG